MVRTVTVCHSYAYTRCKFTEKPRVANCIRVHTCTCSAACALVTRVWCVKLVEVNSLKFDRRNWKTKVPASDRHYWLISFGKHFCFLWFAIRCRCLASRRSAWSPLTFFMVPSLALFLFRSCLPYADPVLNQPSLESAIFGISHAACAGARDNTRIQY